MAIVDNLNIILAKLANGDSGGLAAVRAAVQSGEGIAETIAEVARQRGIEVDVDALVSQVDAMRALHALMSCEPQVWEVLKSHGGAEAVREVQRLAAKHGMALDAQALSAVLQPPPAEEAGMELDDAALRDVAGGVVGDCSAPGGGFSVDWMLNVVRQPSGAGFSSLALPFR